MFCIVQIFDTKKGTAFARSAAFFFTKILPIRRRILRENLQTAFPGISDAERQNLVQSMWEHLFLMGVEIALIRRKIRDIHWTDFIDLDHAEPMLSLMHQDRPVFIVTGHFGNFEAGGFSLGILSYPSHTVARTLDNPFINQFIKSLREATGQYLIPKNGGAPEIMNVCDKNGLMVFLTDQWAGRKGCMINFFGKPASTFKAIAVLSIQYKAPIAVCFSLRKTLSNGQFDPLHFRLKVVEFFDPNNMPADIQNVKEITQWFSTVLEQGIGRCPDQYWWLHRRWKY
jgi:KDO2-lipid IV(A) lauroyltransferase